jgi:hypothetical protein
LKETSTPELGKTDQIKPAGEKSEVNKKAKHLDQADQGLEPTAICREAKGRMGLPWILFAQLFPYWA